MSEAEDTNDGEEPNPRPGVGTKDFAEAAEQQFQDEEESGESIGGRIGNAVRSKFSDTDATAKVSPGDVDVESILGYAKKASKTLMANGERPDAESIQEDYPVGTRGAYLIRFIIGISGVEYESDGEGRAPVVTDLATAIIGRDPQGTSGENGEEQA